MKSVELYNLRFANAHLAEQPKVTIAPIAYNTTKNLGTLIGCFLKVLIANTIAPSDASI